MCKTATRRRWPSPDYGPVIAEATFVRRRRPPPRHNRSQQPSHRLSVPPCPAGSWRSVTRCYARFRRFSVAFPSLRGRRAGRRCLVCTPRDALLLLRSRNWRQRRAGRVAAWQSVTSSGIGRARVCAGHGRHACLRLLQQFLNSLKNFLRYLRKNDSRSPVSAHCSGPAARYEQWTASRARTRTAR